MVANALTFSYFLYNLLVIGTFFFPSWQKTLKFVDKGKKLDRLASPEKFTDTNTNTVSQQCKIVRALQFVNHIYAQLNLLILHIFLLFFPLDFRCILLTCQVTRVTTSIYILYQVQ